MTQQSEKFRVKKKNLAKALQAIKDLGTQTSKMGGGSSTGERWFAWVTTDEFVNAKTLKEALSAWRWDSFEDEKTGDLTDLLFQGEKLGDDEILFNAIAPFVEKGSFIAMEGEDGTHWKWKFDGKTMTEVSGKVVYEDD